MQPEVLDKEAPRVQTLQPVKDVKRDVQLMALDRPDPLEPQTFGALQELALYLSKSTLVPDTAQNNPANVVMLIIHGRSLGMTVAQSLQNVALIGKRLAVWGETPLAIVRARAGQLLTHFKEGWEQGTETAWCEVQRRGEEMMRREFSMTEARKIKMRHHNGPDTLLIEKDTWRNYPRRMCKFKARNEALNDAFPEFLLGIVTVEEASEYIEAEVIARDGVPVAGWEGLVSQMEEATATAIVRGFDELKLSPAERLTWLKKHDGKEAELLAALKDEYALRKTGGRGRVAKLKAKDAEPAVAEPEGPATMVPSDIATDAAEPTSAAVGQDEKPQAAQAATKLKPASTAFDF